MLWPWLLTLGPTWIEEEKVKKMEKESERAKIGSFSFSQQRLDGRNHSQFHKKTYAPSPSSSSAPVPEVKKDYWDRALGSMSQRSFTNRHTNKIY